MNYKDTLLLPKTDFPMKADLVTREPERLKIWEEQGLYEKIQEARKTGPSLCCMMARLSPTAMCTWGPR